MVLVSGLKFTALGLGFGFRVLGFCFMGLGFRVEGLRFFGIGL